MTFKTVAGGFEVSAEDRMLVNTQRAITKTVNQNFIQVGAVFLKQSGKIPIDEKWAETMPLQTNLQDWIDDENLHYHNVGFNLQFGWLDIDIDADDPFFNECVVAALVYNGVDTRFSFGRRSVGVPTHVLVQLAEEEASNFEELKRFEPRGFRIDGKRYMTELRSYPTGIDAKNLQRQAKQVVMPGSIYTHDKEENRYDLSVWYDGQGRVADNVRSIASTTPRRVSFNQVVRSIAFATFLYVVRSHWVEGQRQSTAVKVAGWLARVVKDGQALNNHEAVAKDVFCPVDTDEIAESLIQFVADYCEDSEAPMRVRSYRDAVEKLERNPDAKIPGWPAMEALVGAAQANALRATFIPGSDVSILTKLAERYAYDENDGMYIDRKRHSDNHLVFFHEPSTLERRHIDEVVMISGKPRAAFKMYETSKMRIRVAHRTLYPDMEPGSIFRMNKRGEIISDDDEEDGFPVFNTWRGWPIEPVANPDPVLMEECVAYLDRLLGYLTCDTPAQIEWIKQWFSWTLRNPGIKQQIALVMVGDQGVGKSFFGNIFMPALMGALWGTSSANIIDNKFNVGPFIDKMMVFIDEVKFHNESGTDEVKKIIRNVDVPGMLKFGEGGNFKIYSRVAFASNTFDMGIGQKSVVDRALFYVKTYSKEFKGLSELEFRAWAETLKPWFEDFASFLQRMDVKQHYMRYFMDMDWTKQEVESIKYSSSQDEDIVTSNMKPSRRVAMAIIEEGRVHEELSLEYPFSLAHLGNRIRMIAEAMNTRPVRTELVLAEFLSTGVLENTALGLCFVKRIGDTVEDFSKAIGVTLQPRYELTPEDYGPNDEPLKKKIWKGGRKGIVQGSTF